MTRDEALGVEFAMQKRESVILNSGVPDDVLMDLAVCNIDRLVAFGLLKLDGPEDTSGKLSTLLWQFNLAGSEKAFRELLDANGLKIVEK